jgi:hypothetical protein
MIASVATSQKKKHHHADKDWREGSRRGWRRQCQPAAITERLSLFFSLSLSLSLYLSAAAHKTTIATTTLSSLTYARTHARASGIPRYARALALSLSLSSLSCAVFSYAQQHQQEVFLPCPVRIPLLLQYRCSSAVEVHSIFYQKEREPDGFSSFVYLLRLLLASLWSSVCFRLPTLAVGFRSSCCRYFRLQS